MRVAVLGTGTMGAPITRRLVGAGHEVRAWNRTRERAKGLGAEAVQTPHDAVAGADVAITMLADGAAVEETMRDALPGLADGGVWAQMSTVGVEWTDRLAAEAEERGFAFVDAPVMGSGVQAEQGQLLPLASGPAAARPRCEEAFAAFSRGILWLGDEPGLGTRLKLVANHWLINSVENLAESLALADALGLDPARFFEVLAGAAFDMPYAHMKGKLMMERRYPPAFTLRLAQKDVRLALEAAEQAGVDLAVARATYERIGRAIEAGRAEEDMAAVYEAIRLAG